MKSVKLKNVTVDFKGLEDVKKRLFDESVKVKTKSLIKYAKETLKQAYLESDYQNRTLNLKDSYVWGVYFQGKRIDYGFLTMSAEAEESVVRYGDNEVIRGRDEAQKFIDSYQPTSFGWEVVFAATMYYGVYLEMTGTYRQRQYLVISSIFDDVERDFGNAQTFQNIYSYMPKGF